ncbi:unnamed protein product [Moneuplotes crassus]|uniref:Uncharacterized protein n=1 Tax=Euplotes crassus TaxID=5936 RepID=A0AAD1UPB3_EUPCR|nr:unnamed protein product [Moneuplotes crassus]
MRPMSLIEYNHHSRAIVRTFLNNNKSYSKVLCTNFIFRNNLSYFQNLSDFLCNKKCQKSFKIMFNINFPARSHHQAILVAFTGDDTGDAPSLKKADVGIAMGITGADVAKAASDMILLDDNIASIAKAHFWASTIPQNIRRLVQVQLVLNLPILSILVMGSIFLRKQPLKSVHFLWVTFIVDFLSIVAQFGDGIMSKWSILIKQDSSPAGSGYITQKVLKHIVIMVLFQTLVILLLIWL